MITILNSVWRAEGIVAIRQNREEIQVLPAGSSEWLCYFYDTKGLAASAFQTLLADWQRELESPEERENVHNRGLGGNNEREERTTSRDESV